MIKNKYAQFGLFLVLVPVFWNILDFLYAKFVSKSPYLFGWWANLIEPLLFAVVLGYLFFLRKKD